MVTVSGQAASARLSALGFKSAARTDLKVHVLLKLGGDRTPSGKFSGVTTIVAAQQHHAYRHSIELGVSLSKGVVHGAALRLSSLTRGRSATVVMMTNIHDKVNSQACRCDVGSASQLSHSADIPDMASCGRTLHEGLGNAYHVFQEMQL